MKLCNYCGRENENDAVNCRECGLAQWKQVMPARAADRKDRTRAAANRPPGNSHENGVGNDDSMSGFVRSVTRRGTA